MKKIFLLIFLAMAAVLSADVEKVVILGKGPAQLIAKGDLLYGKIFPSFGHSRSHSKGRGWNCHSFFAFWLDAARSLVA